MPVILMFYLIAFLNPYPYSLWREEGPVVKFPHRKTVCLVERQDDVINSPWNKLLAQCLTVLSLYAKMFIELVLGGVREMERKVSSHSCRRKNEVFSFVFAS